MTFWEVFAVSDEMYWLCLGYALFWALIALFVLRLERQGAERRERLSELEERLGRLDPSSGAGKSEGTRN